MSLYKKVISGVGWAVTGKVFNQVFQLGFSIVLMRMLVPEDYGLLVMVGVLMGFAEIFVDLGFGQALVQHKNPSSEQCSSIFWLNIFVGVLLTLLFVALAPLVSSFYGVDEMTAIIYALSAKFLINAIPVVPSALLQKKMLFATIVKIDFL